MSLKWEKADTDLLISLVKKYPCLYNVRSPEYLDRAKKAKVFNKILGVMRINMSMALTVENVKQKWKNVRTQYSYEQRMIDKSKKSDCGTSEVYTPKLWCFNQLAFLEAYTRMRQKDDNVKEVDNSTSFVQTGTEDESFIEEPPKQKECVIGVTEARGNQEYNKIKKNCLKFEENKCRICLQEDVKVNWNDCLQDNYNLTYKDCYYKYTQLDYFDDDDDVYLSDMLCRTCSNTLENIHIFITKAIKTHDLLKERLAFNRETTDFETIMISEADTDIKPEILIDPMDEDEDDNIECLNEVSDSCSVTEDSMTSVKQLKRKSNDTETLDKLQTHKAYSKKKKHSSKPWEIPTCCSICPKVLCSKYRAIDHEKTHIENRERNEICPKCGMKFFNKEILRSHLKTHNENREKTHKCEFCDKAFYYTGGLNIHRQKHLGQMIPCSLCTKEYYRQVDLDNHMLSHSAYKISGDIKRKKKYFIQCDTCGVSIRSTQYKAHSARHMNVPLAKCSICDKEFFSRNSCINHLKALHKVEKEEISNCVIGYKTSYYSNLFMKQTVGNLFTKD